MIPTKRLYPKDWAEFLGGLVARRLKAVTPRSTRWIAIIQARYEMRQFISLTTAASIECIIGALASALQCT